MTVLVILLLLALVVGLWVSLYQYRKPLKTKKLVMWASVQILMIGTALAWSIHYTIPSSGSIQWLSALTVLVAALGGSLPAIAIISSQQKERILSNTIENPTKIFRGILSSGRGTQHLSGEITDSPKPAGSVLAGGLWIGILERALITLALLTGQQTLLAVVIAVKGLARYPELTSSEGAAEKFIIGTFASALWASCCALIVLLAK